MAELIGTPLADVLFGSLGPDTIVAAAGDDNALGLDGNDRIWGNQGNDALGGNQGNDTLFGGQGNDMVFSGQGDDLGSGDVGNDLLFGNQGADTLFGNGGNDAIFGGRDNDFIFGGRDNDFLAGDLGNDVLSGDKGADTLRGGLGNDLFVLSKGGGGPTPTEADLITDFAVGDRIALTGGLILPEINIQFVPRDGNPDLGDVIIRDLGDNTGPFLAIVQNVAPGTITRATFVASLDTLTGDDSGGSSGGGGGSGGGSGGTTGNVPPVAQNSSINTTEDNFVTGFLPVTDANNDQLTFSIVSNGSLGTVSLSDPQSGFFIYRPNPNQNGQDSFTFLANDGTADSNQATISVNVFAVEDVPVANSGTVSTELNIAQPITLSGSDGDGDPLTIGITRLPSNGTLFQTEDGTTKTVAIAENNTLVSNAQGIVIFEPDDGFIGSAAFGYVVNDGKANSAEATIDVNVGGTFVNRPPEVDLNGTDNGNNVTVTFFSGDPVPISDGNLTVLDSDNDEIVSATVQIANLLDNESEVLEVTIPDELQDDIQPPNYNQATGTLTLTGVAPASAYETVLRMVTYNNTAAVPNGTTRTLTVLVNDGTTNSIPALSLVNYGPIGNPDTVRITQNTIENLPASAFIANDIGVGLRISEASNLPAGITANGTPVASFTFNSNTPINDSFNYRITDTLGNERIAEVTVSTVTLVDGPNTIIGSDGPDILDGQIGGDEIDGREGDDVLIGSRGTDEITGGLGRDTLMGGDNDDIYRYSSLNEELDTIQDFNLNSNNERIEFNDGAGLLFNASNFAGGNLDSSVEVTEMGASGTDISTADLIIWNVGSFANASEVDNALATQDGATGNHVVVVYQNSIFARPVLYYDTRMNAAGNGSDIAILDNLTISNFVTEMINRNQPVTQVFDVV